MKFCVFGAGAVGGFVGGMVARTNADVSLVARGEHLSALQKNGLRIITPDEEFTVTPPATDNPAELGIQDIVFLSAKAHSLTQAAEAPAAADRTRYRGRLGAERYPVLVLP